MQISEVIDRLQKLQAEHGDLPVCLDDIDQGTVETGFVLYSPVDEAHAFDCILITD